MNISLDDQKFCFIGKNTVFKGDIQLDGPTHISGHVIGNIKVNDKFKLSLEPSSYINGTIHGHDIEIFGKVEGDIIAEGSLFIYPSANVSGKINAHSLIIKPGSSVNMIGHTLEK